MSRIDVIHAAISLIGLFLLVHSGETTLGLLWLVSLVWLGSKVKAA